MLLGFRESIDCPSERIAGNVSCRETLLRGGLFVLAIVGETTLSLQ